MKPDLSALHVSTTKPRGKVAKLLAARGLRIVPITEDEGNVKIDRNDVTTKVIDRNRAAKVLVKLRHGR